MKMCGKSKGITRPVPGGIVIERCATAEEAIAMLKETPHRHSFGYTVLDKQGINLCCGSYAKKC